MGNCLLEKTALNDDKDCGRALSTLGRVQLELRKLVDSYRSHIILTVTKPSESLLNELRKVEEMKLQCDEKREVYEYLSTQHRDKVRSRGGKGDSVSSRQLHAAREEYDDAARLCVFRVESLKQGQCRSLFTQAARHHAAQLNFFRRALESLEAVEPQISAFAEKQHIDYQLSGLGEVEFEYEEASSYESYEGGELSFDYRPNKHESDAVGASRISVEADVLNMHASVMEDAVTSTAKHQGEHVFHRPAKASSHSAPIYAEKFDSAERNKETLPAVKKFHTHVLPTPADAKSWTSRPSNVGLLSSGTTFSGGTNNLWHSSPLETEKQRKSTEDNLLGRNLTKGHTPSIPLPRPSVDEVVGPQSDSHYEFDHKKTKRLAFSGPLASRTPSSKPSVSSSGPMGSIEPLQINSGLLSQVSIVKPPPSIPAACSASPPPTSSPRISELHELPLPPGSVASKPVNIGVIGHSAPLINRKREVSPTNRTPPLAPNTGTALPPPPLMVPRSFSIPSRDQRATTLDMAKLVGSPRSRGKVEKVASPPLTPIRLSNATLR
ncbi:hypothetical protein Leryth_009292 [Lithospermum erythrorhizon]|nr:hypothetical protein Leryth_009292 [Lithospermum erythrorhizon]